MVGLTQSIWRPLLLYPFEEAWNLFLYRADQSLNRPKSGRSYLRWHAAFWDEMQRWPLYGLDEHLLLERKYLVANAGQVLSRTMIVEHVWDQSFEGLTNIVDVYVRHLRTKVDDAFPTKLIHTVRHIGYSFGHAA